MSDPMPDAPGWLDGLEDAAGLDDPRCNAWAARTFTDRLGGPLPGLCRELLGEIDGARGLSAHVVMPWEESPPRHPDQLFVAFDAIPWSHGIGDRRAAAEALQATGAVVLEDDSPHRLFDPERIVRAPGLRLIGGMG